MTIENLRLSACDCVVLLLIDALSFVSLVYTSCVLGESHKEKASYGDDGQVKCWFDSLVVYLRWYFEPLSGIRA